MQVPIRVTNSRKRACSPALEDLAPNTGDSVSVRTIDNSDVMSVFAESLSQRSRVPPSDSGNETIVERSARRDSEDEGDMEPEQVPSGVYMAVCKQTFKERIGIAYFDTEGEVMFVGQFTAFEVVERLKHQLSPTVIITTSKPGEQLYLSLAGNDSSPDAPFQVCTAKHSDFSLEGAKNRLRLLTIGDAPRVRDDSSRMEQNLQLMSVFNIEEEELIKSCGGLLSYLFKHRILNQLEKEETPLLVRSIKRIDINDVLHLDSVSLQALGIFMQDSVGHRKKEGLSIFGVLNQTVCKNSERLLRSWLRYPTQNTEILTSRLQHVAYFVLPEAEDLTTEIRAHMRNVRDVPRLARRFIAMTAKLPEWISLHESLQAMISVHGVIVKASAAIPICGEIAPLLTTEIVQLNAAVSCVIDFGESKRVNQGICVRHGISDDLDQLKRYYEGLEDFLTMCADRDMKSGVIPNQITAMTYMYAPQLGYHVQVPYNASTTPSLEIPGFSFQFKTDEHVFYKNRRCEELDQVLGDLKGIIADLESSIIRALTSKVLDRTLELCSLACKLYEMDVLLSLAAAAKQHQLCCPTLSDDNELRIEEGRHLLQELCCDRFIPNDTEMSSKEESTCGMINVISGPNNSGKSVYLKQVGLIVYLAHVGSFVPAKSATIGLTDGIFTRIHSVDSVVHTLSTFSHDCSQISYMLRHCTKRSLLLVDEFGKGTCSFDGIALLSSMLKFLTAKGIDSPRSFFTSHFHEIVTYHLVEESRLLRFKMMSILSQERPEADDVVFLYKVVAGSCLHSFGFKCAELAGISQAVIQRARRVSKMFAEQKPVDAMTIGAAEASSNQSYLDIFQAFLGLDLDSSSDSDVAAFLGTLNRSSPQPNANA